MRQLLAIALLSLIPVPFLGGETKPLVMPLWPKGAPGAIGNEPKDIPTLTVYLPEKPNGAAVVICPGGGYGNLAMNHEGHDVAKWLNSHGIAGIILQYRHAPRYKHPTPLTDAQQAIRTTRQNAAAWKIDPKRVGILGFSAGGHLASTAATQFDSESRPDFAVLVYPVITLTGPFAHNGSRNNLLGKDADAKLVESLCNQNRVTVQTPPTFLVHTSEDKGVPPENSILFYQALRTHKVPAEMHIYEKGPHGMGLGTKKELPFITWPDRCIAWLEGQGFVSRR